MTEQRCGQVFVIGESPSGKREACCWRPVWEDTDRCRWHLDRDKEDILVRPLGLDGEGYLQGSIFRGAVLTGVTELADRQLQRCDFSEVDLRDADLSGADLRNSTFRNADLRGADLTGADVRNAEFIGADIRDANLSEVDGRGATFERANLEKASFIRSNLRDASIKDAKLYEVLFSDTWINEGTDLGWRCIYEAEPNIVADAEVIGGATEDETKSEGGDEQEDVGDEAKSEDRDRDERAVPVEDEDRDTERPEDETDRSESDEDVAAGNGGVSMDEDVAATEPREEVDAETDDSDDGGSLQSETLADDADTGEHDGDVRQNDAAAWTYRALEHLCRENALPAKTRWYYVREKDSRRKQAWASGNYTSALKSEMSRWVMEYGSNPWRIVGFSLLVVVTWAFLYPLTGGLTDTTTGNTVGVFVETPADAPRYYVTVVFLKSLYFSVVTFATLGYGDIIPVGGLSRALATVETLLGSLLTALLVFVLSRIVTW